MLTYVQNTRCHDKLPMEFNHLIEESGHHKFYGMSIQLKFIINILFIIFISFNLYNLPGHLTMEMDLLVLVKSTLKEPTEQQLQICVLETEKLAVLIQRGSPRVSLSSYKAL